MKRVIPALLLTAALLSAMLAVTVFAAPSNLLGDLDQNGRLDSADVRIILRYMVGDRSFTAAERALADCDGNGRINTKDARYVLNVLTNNETPSTIATTTTTVVTTTTTSVSLGDDGYYDEIVKP